MNPLPLASIRLRWSNHFSALRWLGLLYRRPQQFQAALSTCSVREQLVTAFWLLVHSAPYVLVMPASGRWLVESLRGLSIHLDSLVGGIAIEIAGGIVAWIIRGIVGGIAFGIGFGIAGGMAIGIVIGIGFWMAIGMAIGTGFGMAIGILGGIVSGISFRIGGMAIGIAVAIALAIVGRIDFGIAFGIGFAVSSTRIYYHLAHPLFIWPRLHGRWYTHHPVAWDDLCSVPFPGLDRLLVDYAEKAPESGAAEIERLISHYPSQRVMALRARVRLLARQAGKTADLIILDEIVAALPEGKKGFLAQTSQLRAAVHEIVTLQSRLNTIDRPVLRELFARLLCKEIENFRHRIGGFYEPLATEFRRAANQWLKIAEKQLREAQAVAKKDPVPQVFRAGDPVDREKEAFVPRDSIVGNLERQVLLSTGCPGVVLYGRRRVGKSTVLRNLSGFLPSTVKTVNVSMQNPEAFTSLNLLAHHLVQEISTVFVDERPPVMTPKDLKDLFGFLSACNQILEKDRRGLVISVDEYENIDQKIGQKIFPEDLLAMFRESIQSHRRITWIFAGSHEITELVHAPWTSYLVSARTVEVPLFSDQETRLLLTEPFKHSSLWRDDEPNRSRPRFEPGFWGEGGIERIHAEAGGWPHLVQLIAETIVDLLNDEGGLQVTSPLMERALDRAIISGHNVLYELLRRENTLPGQWEYLSKFRIRETQPLPDDEAIVQSLRRRLLVEEEAGQWRLRVPLMSRWLRTRG
jgi:hypothetical protein